LTLRIRRLVLNGLAVAALAASPLCSAVAQAPVERLGREVAAIGALPAVEEKLRNLGVGPDGRQGEASSAFQRAEVAKWGKVIQEAGIQPE
jgi:tripartite-type tricarboxylate transporter receptor subunit TctC